MPSSRDRRRLEVPTYLYERLEAIARREDRTVAGLAHQLLGDALADYRPRWVLADHLNRFAARPVLAFAEEEAHRLNHHYIGTEHILLGLLRDGDGGGARSLTALGITLDHVRGAVTARVGLGDRPATDKIEMTPRARDVLALAVDEADHLGHLPVMSEHVLLGLAREGKGIAAFILTTSGVDLEQVRQQTLTVLRTVALTSSLC